MLPSNFNHLYYFYRVAVHKSVSKASKELLIAQSALSTQLKQLEESLDTTLFNRTKGGMALTDTGELVFRYASTMFETYEDMRRAMVLATDDKEAGRNLFRAAFAPYYATPVYNKFLAWAGYGDAASTITEGWAAKDRAKTSGALTDEMIDEIAIIGSEDEIRERIREDAAGGVHTSIIAPLGINPEDAQRTFDAFRADVFQF